MNKISLLSEQEQLRLFEGDWDFLQRFNFTPLDCASTDENLPLVSILTLFTSKELYVFVKSTQKELIHTDRAYQNGDGFHFVISKILEGNKPSNAFYVVGVSPKDDGFKRIFEWYHDVDFTGRKLDKAEVQHQYCGEELIILARVPWDHLTPYKPYLQEDLGFNLSYVKNINDQKYVYYLKTDESIQSENAFREYVPYKFAHPEIPEKTDCLMALDALNAPIGKAVSLSIGVNIPHEMPVSIKILNNNTPVIHDVVHLNAGYHKLRYSIDESISFSGVYKIDSLVELNGEVYQKNFKLCVWSPSEIEALASEFTGLTIVDDVEMKESYHTLQFFYEDLKSQIYQLKPDDDFAVCEQGMRAFLLKMKSFGRGESLFVACQKLRMGFVSKFDASLQPYSLYLPNSCENQNYNGLMVCLHGSGSDDRHGFQAYMEKIAEEKGYILAAPFARGTSHAYCPKEALEDIADVTEIIASMFQIPKDSIVLTGFSMGGYGVYRMFDYRPDLYGALAVFSGHHNVPEMFGMTGEPNYLELENLKKFDSVKICIYHGLRDRNCDYREIKIFTDALCHRNRSAQVMFSDCGHEGLNALWYDSFSRFLEENKF